jgi:outer membrane protein
MKKMYKLLFATLLTAMSLNLNAQKFGYVNTQELVNEIPEIKEANANIETFAAQLQKKGQEMLKSLQTKYQEIQRKQEQGEISPKQLEIEGQNLKAEEQKIMEFEQSSSVKIQQKSETLLKPIKDRIQTAIDAVAAEHGYTYIFDFSTGFVLYADPSSNVSALVKAKLR